MADIYAEVTAVGIQGLSGTGASGVYDGATGATGPQGDTGATGPQGPVGASGVGGGAGATGPQGIQGASGSTGPQGIQGASGVAGNDGATGSQGVQGATGSIGLTGATGSGVGPTVVYTTSSTNEVVIETIDSTLYRSVKYDMQATSGSMYQVSELRLLIDGSNVFLTEYGVMGDALGIFASYYSPLNNNYSGSSINNGGLSVWTGTTLRFYTTNNAVQQALLSAPKGTVITLNGSVTATLSTAFVETDAGIYDAVTTTSRSPALLISNVTWTGSGDIELRYKPDNSVTVLKYKRTFIEV